MTRIVTIRVPEEPVPWARARLNRYGAHFTSDRTRSAQNAIAWQGRAAMASKPPLDGPLSLSIAATFKRPKACKVADWKPTRPDIDNIAKNVLDALNGIAWRDDAQVAVLHTSKAYGDQPGLEIAVSSLESPDDRR